jgi:hypothetical protein
MKQTIEIEIEVPDGHKAVYNKDAQKVEIVRVELPKSWEEFCGDNPIKKNEYFIDEYGEITYAAEKHRATNLKNILPNKETAEAFLALMQLVQLRDCYRQGWKPNWKENTVKQNIICFEGVLGTDWSINVQYVLSFQSKEIRNEFLENFKDLIEQAKELI